MEKVPQLFEMCPKVCRKFDNIVEGLCSLIQYILSEKVDSLNTISVCLFRILLVYVKGYHEKPNSYVITLILRSRTVHVDA